MALSVTNANLKMSSFIKCHFLDKLAVFSMFSLSGASCSGWAETLDFEMTRQVFHHYSTAASLTNSKLGHSALSENRIFHELFIILLSNLFWFDC